jgi:AcrR family transcriptional regulator
MSERYHHGNLRQALVDEALQVLREEGAADLSLRGVAARAGVSRSAPYHHFPDKESLLAAVIEHGFRELHRRLALARDSAGTVLDRLRHTGEAYVYFAMAEPALYRLMFGTMMEEPERHPDMIAAGDATFQVLTDLIVEGQHVGQVLPGPPRAIALTAWSTCHGIASLMLDKSGRSAMDPHCPAVAGPLKGAAPAEVIIAVLQTLEHGLRA